MGSPMARLRRALVAVQAVLTTGCPCLGHLHCTDLHITAAGPTAWRVQLGKRVQESGGCCSGGACHG